MLEEKRKFERFDLFVVTKIGRNDGSAQNSLGLTKNFSREGLSVETRDFDFVPNNNLDLVLTSPKGNTKIPLTGSVVWKRQAENTNIAGIKFIFQDEKNQDEILEEISFFGNIPRDSILSAPKTDSAIEDETDEMSASISTGENEVLLEQAPKLGFVKEYLESGECEVTFRLPKEVAQGAQNVTLVGDFNDWDTADLPMTRLEDGSFQISLSLIPVMAYRFRYLIDGHRWENDAFADTYSRNDYGWHDSVVMV